MDVTDVWVANDEGTEIVRARDIAGVSLDYDGNVTVRLTGGDGTVVTIAGHRTHHEEHRPDNFHRQLVRVVAELSDAGAFLVRAVHEETRGSASLCSGVGGFLPPTVRSGPAERSKDNNQKAERAVVHALGLAVADRPEGNFRTRVISKQSRLTPRLGG